MATAKSVERSSSRSSSIASSNSAQSPDFVKMANDGIRLLLCNNWQGALDLYSEHKNESILMSAGYSFVECLLAFLSFEDEQKEQALRALQQTTELCKLGLTKSRKSRKKHSAEMSDVEDSIRREIIISDCLLFQAGLIIVNQDVTSYIRGGWCIRQAWKRYRKLYQEVRELHSACTNGRMDHLPTVDGEVPTKSRVKKVQSDFHIVNHTSGASMDEAEFSREFSADDIKSLGEASDNLPDLSNLRSKMREMSVEDLDRLLGAVSFGYGVFRLFISLIPPKILWWIQLLGFEGNQDEGLTLLEFVSQSGDVKAPIATLVLVWYHTTIRPFFALDGRNLAAGVDDACRILESALKEYPESALLLYFRCRIHRLQGNADAAMESCKQAFRLSTNQRETRQICLYELGRMSVMQMNYSDAYECFIVLKNESRWSKSFNAYLSAVCCGAIGDVDAAVSLMSEVPGLMIMKDNRLEIFVKRRAEQVVTMKFDKHQLSLLSMEILYIWTSFPGCSEPELLRLLDACRCDKKPDLEHLNLMIQGVIYTELKDHKQAEKCFLECIRLYEERNLHADMHIAAFAYFEMGMLKSQHANDVLELQEPKRYFQHIKTHYKNYDFEFRLTVKVNAALKRITDAEKEAGVDSTSGRSCSIQ